MYSELLLKFQELYPETPSQLFGALLLVLLALFFLALFANLSARYIYFLYQKLTIRILARINTAASLNKIANIAKHHVEHYRFDLGEYGVNCLQNIGSHNANNLLLDFIGSSFLELYARETLVELAKTEYIEFFRKNLHSTQDPRVQRGIIEILGFAATDDALCILIDSLTHLSDNKIRALEALCKFDNPIVLELILGELKYVTDRVDAIEKYLESKAHLLDVEDALTIIQCIHDKTSKVDLDKVFISIPSEIFFLAIDNLIAQKKESSEIIKTAFEFTQRNNDKKACEQVLIKKINNGEGLVLAFLPLVDIKTVYSGYNKEANMVCLSNSYIVKFLKNLISGCCTVGSKHFLVEMVKWPVQTMDAEPFKVEENVLRQWETTSEVKTLEQYSFNYDEIDTGVTITERRRETEKKTYYHTSRPHRKLAKKKLLDIQKKFNDSMNFIMPDLESYQDEGQTLCIISTDQTSLGATYHF